MSDVDSALTEDTVAYCFVNEPRTISELLAFLAAKYSETHRLQQLEECVDVGGEQQRCSRTLHCLSSFCFISPQMAAPQTMKKNTPSEIQMKIMCLTVMMRAMHFRAKGVLLEGQLPAQAQTPTPLPAPRHTAPPWDRRPLAANAVTAS